MIIEFRSCKEKFAIDVPYVEIGLNNKFLFYFGDQKYNLIYERDNKYICDMSKNNFDDLKSKIKDPYRYSISSYAKCYSSDIFEYNDPQAQSSIKLDSISSIDKNELSKINQQLINNQRLSDDYIFNIILKGKVNDFDIENVPIYQVFYGNNYEFIACSGHTLCVSRMVSRELKKRGFKTMITLKE